MSLRRLAALACVMVALAACGGGGGGGDGSGSNEPPPTGNPPTPTPTADELARAQNARLRMEQAPQRIAITWFDTFDNESGYKIERRVGDGAWITLETLPATDGGSSHWDTNTTTSGTYRVSAILRDYSLPLFAAPGESEIAIDMAAVPEVRTEPADNDGLRISVSNAGSAESVEYFLGRYQFGSVKVAHVTSGADFATTLPAERLLREFSLTLVARIHKSTGLTTQASTSLLTNNIKPAVLLQVAPAPATDDSLVLTARATSIQNIASIQFFVNDQPLQRVDLPDRFGNWVHAIAPGSLPSNVNTFRAVATDGSGESASMAVEYALDAVPSLTVQGIFDGMIASGGRLAISGTFGENMPGSVLTIELGSNDRVFRTRTSPFNLDYPLSGLSGERIVTVRAESPTGKVNTRTYYVVLPSTTRAYELIGTDVAELLAADRGILLYRKHSGAVILRNTAGAETALQLPAGSSFSKWWLAADRILAQELVNGHLHVFTTPGQTRDLSPASLLIARPIPSLRGEWLAFASGSFEYSAYHMPTDRLFRVQVVADQVYLQADIDVTTGHERILFPATIAGAAGIYAYGLNTGTTDLLLSGAYQQVSTDGTRLVVAGEHRIDVAPLHDPTAVTHLTASGALNFVQDGLIGFGGVNDRDQFMAVALDDGTATLPLAVFFGAFSDLAGLQNGYLLFSESGKLHSWSRTTGKTFILDAAPPTLHTQGVAYILTGSAPGALYRTTLP